MELKINNRKFTLQNGIDVTLAYDSIGSAFAFALFFDPDNSGHKEALRPGLYPSITIEQDGELLLTGTVLNYKFNDSPQASLIGISGYSKTGVFEDCEIPQECYPLQSIGLSLTQIAEKISKVFGINVIVDSAVTARANKVYSSSTAKDSNSIKEYLTKLAGQRQIMVTHNEFGNLVLTEAKTNSLPVYDFVEKMPGVEMAFDFDGQKMHSSVTLQKQATKRGKGNAGISSFQNPYVEAFRPKTVRQTSGDNVDTDLGARNVLSDELKGMLLTITLDRWTLGGKIVRPNSIITVTNPRLFLYSKTKFFIQSVNYKSDQNGEVAILSCVLPECFTNETPKNIFV